MKLLVTGAAGMLGRDVMLAAGNAGHDVVGFGRAELDITDAAALGKKFDLERPDVVINCAAWTDVDGAEEAEEAALAVNGAGAGNVAAAAAAVGASVVYVSSDYVFDGNKGEPYVESDQTAPISAYGRTKLAGEEATVACSAMSSSVWPKPTTSWPALPAASITSRPSMPAAPVTRTFI